MGQENQTQKTIGFNTVGRKTRGKTRPRDHIWAKTIYETIYGQRPYMGFNTVGQENQTQKTIGFNTVGRKTRGKTRPRDHIWAKTIYETIYGQRPYMGFNTVGQENQTQKTIGFNTVGRKTRGKTRPETIYGQRPYMRPYMGKDHIWAKTIYGIQHSGTGKSDPKDDRIQHSWQENPRENQTQRPYMGKDHIWDHIWDSTQWDRKIRPKR